MTTGDLLVITPSRGRPQNIARLLDAVHATMKMNTHVHVAIDDDDPRLTEYQYVMEKAAGEGDKLTVGPRKNLAGWTNEIAVPATEEYTYLASLGDDHVTSTPGWDKALIRAIERMGGTGFSYPWDGTREDIPEAVVLSSSIVRALGWMALPESTHWYIDTVWADLGRGIGALKHCRAVKVEHVWRADQTSKDSGEKLTRDRDAYYLWRKERMESDIKIISALRDQALQPA